MVKLGKAYVVYPGGLRGREKEYIAVSRLLPVWSAEIAPPETNEDDVASELWNLIAYSIIHELVSFSVPENILNDIKIKAGWEHPYEHIEGARIRELNRFMAAQGRSVLGDLMVAKVDLREVASRAVQRSLLKIMESIAPRPPSAAA